jgi:pimeloyl-ACP methyl ester carboxylesterase
MRTTDHALVLVHSPLVGPLTWRAVADRFTVDGQRTVVPDLTGAMAGPAPYQPRIASAVAAVADPLGVPVVLIGHSGAGPLLPGIAATLAVPVLALVYVDAGLPYPGQSWFERAPQELAAHLRDLESDGWLPPWHEWFPPAALAEALPDPELRARFTGELSRLPMRYFEEPTPTADWPGPAGYLLLSEVYRDDARRAAALGMPVVERLDHHLALVTSPAVVVAGLRELIAALSRGGRVASD